MPPAWQLALAAAVTAALLYVYQMVSERAAAAVPDKIPEPGAYWAESRTPRGFGMTLTRPAVWLFRFAPGNDLGAAVHLYAFDVVARAKADAAAGNARPLSAYPRLGSFLATPGADGITFAEAPGAGPPALDAFAPDLAISAPPGPVTGRALYAQAADGSWGLGALHFSRGGSDSLWVLM